MTWQLTDSNKRSCTDSQDFHLEDLFIIYYSQIVLVGKKVIIVKKNISLKCVSFLFRLIVFKFTENFTQLIYIMCLTGLSMKLSTSLKIQVYFSDCKMCYIIWITYNTNTTNKHLCNLMIIALMNVNCYIISIFR